MPISMDPHPAEVLELLTGRGRGTFVLIICNAKLPVNKLIARTSLKAGMIEDDGSQFIHTTVWILGKEGGIAPKKENYSTKARS